MKKKVFSLMMTLLLAFMGVAKAETIEIGTGTSTSYYIPFNSLYGYSFTEQVYSASDIGTAGNITSISFYLGTSNSSAQTNDITLYMKNVTRSEFSSTSDYETVTTGDIVYSGSWTIPADYTGWVSIPLTTPFAYDGTSNLMVAMHEFTSGYSTRYFTYTSVTNASVQWYSDSANPDPYNLGSYSGSSYVRSYLANAQLEITPGGGGESGEITIHDGSATNGYVPVYGFYADAYLKAEMVYPAAELSAFAGGTINSMTFYAETPAAEAWTSTWQVFLSEVSNATISDFYGPGTVVYEGALDGTGTEMTINFTTPYQYNGGNLLVGVYNTSTGNYKSVTWAGDAVDGASVQGYSYTDLSSVSPTQRNFLPKVTIAYTTAGGGSETFAYGFEDGMQGWTAITEGEGNGWYYSSESESYSCYDYTGFGHNESDGFAVSQSYSDCTYDAYDADNYLVSPQKYTLEYGAYVNFFFDYATDSYPDYFEVCVATVNNPTANDFTAVWSSDLRSNAAKTQVRHNNNRYGNWREVTIDLSAYAGQDVWIAFHHQDYDEYEVWIDDVTVFTGDSTGPAYEVVDAIEIEGFVAPAWGVTPVDNTYVPEDANYTLVESGWDYYYPSRGETKGHHGRLIEPDLNFTEMDGRAYYMWFEIEANEGYGFTNSTEPLLNGMSNMFHEDSYIGEYEATLYTIDFFPADVYENGLHTLAMYGVGENAYENIDRLLIERPNGAWMEPYHFQLYNDGTEDVEVVLIDFLHNNGYFSMAEGTEYPFTVAATGRPGVDLYINTNIDWTDTEEINSLLAVNTSERSTHLYPIIAAPYTPYCPDVVETAFPITNITAGTEWSMWTSEMWNEANQAAPYELHDNYTLPFPEIPEGYDAVMTFTLDHDMMLNAYVSDGECDGELNGKVALYRAGFNGEGGPMANNYYDGRPFHNGGGSTPGAYTSIDFETGNFSQFNSYTNDGTYPWYVAAEANHGGTYGMKSGNAGVASSTSTFTATVNYTADGTVSFDYNARGEGTSYDVCKFVIDGVQQFSYGAVNAWNSFSANVAAGQHTFTWIYQKDSSVNPAGDCFYVDNIVFDGGRLVARTPRGNRATAVELPHLTQTRSGNTRGGSMTNWTGINRGSTAYGICVYNDGTLDLGINQFDIDNLASASIINDYNDVGGMVYNPNNGHFYVSSYSYSELYEVDADGTILNTVDTDYPIVSLAWDQTTNTLYSMDSYGWLNITDPTTGYMTDIDALSNADVMCITANASGQLFGVLYGETSALVSINKNDASVTTLVTLNVGCNYAQSMAFDMNDNKLYWAQCYEDANLYEINPTTGALTLKAANTSEICGLCIPASSTPTPPTPPTPVDPTEHAYTAGPVIEGLNVLAGTYYLVASSTCEDFEVTIGFEELPCPIEPVTGIYPEDNAYDIPKNDLTLRWTLNDYCNEYRLVFGSTYYPDDEPNHPATYIGEWTSDLAESFRITDVVTLWNNTNYFWRIDQRSNPGTPYECVTIGPVFGFTTSLNAPTHLQASNTRIFEYEENVTLSWTPIQDRTYRRYRIYMDGEMVHQTPNNQVVTSWVIPQDLLTYNMYNEQGYIFNVTAVYDEGESPVSNPVEIWVSGNGTVSGYVYEQDETTPIGGVTVTIIGTNEFGQTETYTYTTDNNGYYHGNIHAGTYGYAVATMEGYQNAETTHELPLDIVYDEETDHVDFIMDELFIAPAHVCAEPVYVQGVQGDSLVHVWWDFNFFTTLTENFEDWANTPFAWQNDATYPWALTTEAHEGTYAFKSGNAGVSSSTSTLEVTVNIPQDGQFSFDLWARGESTTDTYDWDVCRFFFDGQQMFQYGQHSGWETYSMPITAGPHTFQWVYKKDSTVDPSAGDCFIIDNIVFVGHADRADRSLHHYNIYRTDCYNDGPYSSDNTVFLSTVWRPDTSYMDVQWPEVPVGVYKYGVSAVYSGNYDGNPNNPRIDYPFEPRESEIVWHNMCSPCIDKDMYLENEVTVNVVLNSADSPEGVQVSFQNLNPGEEVNHHQEGVTLDQTGYYVFPRFRKGDYLVTVGLPGYETIQVEESIWEPRDLRYVLIEIICKVQNLYVSRTGWAMWDPQAPCPGGIEPGPTPGPTPGGSTTFTEGFEGGLNGWNVLTVNAAGGSWIYSDNNLGGYDYTTLAHGGTGFAMCYSYVDYDGAYDTDSYLYTPQKYDIVNGSTLTFWADNANDSYPENFSVCVSTADTPTASSFTQVWSGSAKGAGNAKANVRHDANRYENWRFHSVDLSAYAGQSVYIAFHDVNYDMYEIWIDDVALTAGRAATAERHLEGYKIMCTSIDGEPIFNHNTIAEQPFCQLATDQLVEGETYRCKVAAIYSTGMSEYEEITWQYESCENYAGTVNGLTAEGSTISWDYPGGDQPGPGPDPGQATTFSVGFEGGLPAGWTTIDGNNDGITWCATSAIPTTWTYYAGIAIDWYHTGNDAMCSGSYINGVGAITPNEYLISPQVTLAAGSQLSFWVAACDESYPADHFGVFVSTTGTNPSDFASVQEWTLTAKSGGNGNAEARVRNTVGRDSRATRLGTWYHYTVDLSAYAGQAYIAFRHFNCNDQYIMCLDDVELTAGAKSGVRNPWDLITNLSLTSAGQQAIATDGEFIYSGSWQGTPTGGNRFHKYTLDGTHVEGFEITGMNSVGVRDFTFDGQYFYCGASSSTLYCLDLANQTLVGQTTTGCSAIRHCSYDPERDGFWMGDWSTLALYSRTGALIQSAPAPSSAYGSAYYKDANNVEHLYLFCQPNSDCLVYDYNITTNTLSSTPIFSITDTNAECNGIAGGAFIGEYEGMTAFFANSQQEPNLVAIYELAAAPVPPVPPTPAEGILGAMIFVDGEWEAFVEYPTNSYTYEGDGEEICVRMVYDGTAELPANNFYYAMSCEECIGGLEPTCEPGAPIYGEITANDQVRVYWSEPVPPTPEEGDTFEYDFENGSLDGLMLIDADGDGYNWLANTAFGGHNGSTGIIYSQSYDNNYGALTPDNYVVFPQSSIANGSTFSFWACGQDASWASEHFGVAVSTTGNTSAADFTTIAEWTMTAKGTKAVRDGRDQGNWYNYTVDLSDYAGMDVYIAIRHFNCTDMFYLDVDDVMLGIANKGNRDGIIGYNIYRSEDNVDYALVGSVPGTATEYFDNPGEGTFYYQVTAVYANCESEPAVSGENPEVNYVMVGRTGIGENSFEVNLFPNPTKGNVTIQAVNMHRITVVSVLGQVVFDTELDQDEYILNMSKFNTGMYMVRVYTDEGVTVKRVTVLH